MCATFQSNKKNGEFLPTVFFTAKAMKNNPFFHSWFRFKGRVYTDEIKYYTVSGKFQEHLSREM